MRKTLKLVFAFGFLGMVAGMQHDGAEWPRERYESFEGDPYGVEERWNSSFGYDRDFNYIAERYEQPEVEADWGYRDPSYDVDARQSTTHEWEEEQSGSQARGGEQTVQGRVESWRKVNLRDRQGQREEHTFAKVRFEDGRSALISLRGRANLLRTELQVGERIMARGPMARVSGQSVLMAEQVQLGGSTFDLARGREIPQNTGSKTANRASFSGRVDEFRWTHLGGGNSGRAFAHVGLEDGRSMLVDLGTGGELEELNVSREDVIRVLGWRDSAQGRPVLRANQLWVNGRRHYVRSAAPDGPWGTGRAAGGEQGNAARTNQRSERPDREAADRSGAANQQSRSADEIMYDVVQELWYSPEVDESEISVEVNGGTVILRGDVELPQTKQTAGKLAREVPGVTNVENQLRVSARETVQSETLIRRVNEALREDDQLNAGGIRVDATTGRVILRGQVESYNERARAEQLAGNVEGVWGVVNQLRVQP